VTEKTHPRDIVLIVEDSVENLGMLTQALEEAGMTVLIAIDGDTALKLVGEITPDIILMDALMPGKDGFETTRILKRNDNMAHVPVVFMTGLSETEHIVKGLEAGGVDYVTKPVAPDELVARIRVHLANARASQSARVALDASGRFLLAVNSSGELLWATPQARRLLAHHTSGMPDRLILPLAVRAWVARAAKAGAPAPIIAEAGPNKLEISFLARTGPDQFMLRLTEDNATSAPAALRDKLSLTNREAEVLLWLARGKSNKDIAAILSLSPRTVNKHLEQIYSKLGVENRASATAVASRALAGN